jgi:hypothetical protein
MWIPEILTLPREIESQIFEEKTLKGPQQRSWINGGGGRRETIFTKTLRILARVQENYGIYPRFESFR